MREGFGSCFLCVSVCYHARCYIPCLRVQTAVLQGSLWRSKRIVCVDFAEKALFSSFGVIADLSLTFSASGSMDFTYKINMSRAIYGILCACAHRSGD